MAIYQKNRKLELLTVRHGYHDSYWDKEKMESVLSINPTSLFDRMIFIDKEVDVMRVESREGLKIFQLKIALRGVEPPIWRRIQVPSSLLVGNLLSSGHQRERVKSDCRHHMRHVKLGNIPIVMKHLHITI